MPKMPTSKAKKSGKKRSQPKWAHLPPTLAKKVTSALKEAREYVAKRRKYNKKIK